MKKGILAAVICILVIVLAALCGYIFYKNFYDSKTSTAVVVSDTGKSTDSSKNTDSSETAVNLSDEFLARAAAYESEHSELSQEEIYKRVAMNLDKDPYTDITVIDNPGSITELINKYYRFPEGYAPENMSEVPSSGENGTAYMIDEAAQAFQALSEAAAQQGFVLNACSTYRSQEEQTTLYENGYSTYGQEYADAYWTRPGHSEHQSGLAVDIRINNDTSDLDAVRLYPDEYQWLLDNMADYGFIIRYPDDKEEYTQIAAESWHLRYVGRDLAKYLTENNYCLDEYYGLLFLGEVPDYTS